MKRIRFFLILAVCLGTIALPGLSAAENPPVPEGPEWRLVALNGAAAAAGARGTPTVQFDGGKKSASGFSGVNRFFGGYERDGEKLKFGALAGTRMAGPPEAMKLEADFLAALGSVNRWRVAEGALELLLDGKVVSRFSAQPAAAK